MAYNDLVIADGAVALYPLQESSGATAEDVIGTADGTYTGTINYGEAGLIADPGATSVLLGANGWVSLPGFDFNARSFVVEFWVNLPDTTGIRYLFYNRTADAIHQMFSSYNNGGTMRVSYYADDHDILSALSGSTTYHVVQQYDVGSDTTQVWINGTKAYEGGIGPIGATATSAGFGAAGWASLYFAECYVSHLAVYLDLNLTETQILNHIAGGGGTIFVVSAATSTTAAFSVVVDSAILEVEFQVALSTDTSFSSPVYTATDAGATRYLHTATGLTAGTSYLGRIRIRTSAGWQAYETARPFTTPGSSPAVLTVSPYVSVTERWITPEYGEYISGATYNLTIQPVGANANWYVSADMGANWTTLATATTVSSLAFDSTAYADGIRLVFWLEVPSTQENAYTEATVDNGTLVGALCGVPTQRYWGAGNLFQTGGYTYGYGPVSSSPLTAACFDSVTFDDADEVEVSALIGDSWASGGAWWQQQYSAEGWVGGVVIGASGHDSTSDTTGLFVGYRIQQVMPCARNGGFAIGYPFDGSSTECVLVYGFANSAPTHGGGGAAVTGLYNKTRLPPACNQSFFRGLYVRLTKPDRVGTPNEVRLQIKVGFGGTRGGVTATTGYSGSYDVDTVIDLGYAFACGRTGLAIGKINATVAGDGALATTRLCARPLSSSYCGSTPPGVPIQQTIPTDDTVVCDEVTLDITPPGGTYGPTHSATRWEITSASDVYYASPVVDTGFDTTNLLTYTTTLAPGTYIWRATIQLGSSTLTSADDTFTIAVNTAPSAPTWVKPTPGQLFSSPSSITLNFLPAIDPEGDPLTYEVAYSLDDGVTLVEAFALGTISPSTDTPWNVTGIPPGSIILYVRAFDGCLYGPYDTVCIEITGAACPADPIHVTTVRRIEVWDQVESGGGDRLCFVPDFIDAADHVELAGEDRAQIVLPRISPRITASGTWSHLQAKRVVRIHWRDLTHTEYRVARITDTRTDQDALTSTIELDAIYYDLGSRIVKRVEANGLVHFDFALNLTAAEHRDFILSHAPRYFIAGLNLASSEAFEIQYSWDSCLSAMLKLVEKART